MEKIIIVAIICLFIITAYYFIKYILLKKQIKGFTSQMEKRKDIDYNCSVKVDGFDRDIVNLAVKLNEHTEIQRNIGVEYKRNKEQLNNIISGISHDFRTPLTASLGYLQMIEKSGELSDKNIEYLKIAIEKNTYLKELSDEFFELSKLENNNEEFATEKINLSNLVSDMVMEQYGWLQERNISPVIKITDGIFINSNRRYIIRITENLFSNAEKYTADFLGVTLENNNGKVIFSVYNDTDNLTEIDINRVFEPFYKPSSRNKAGSGLGLYVVKFLSDKLSISTTAEFDENNNFRITIKF